MNIILYGTKTCPRCKILEERLKLKNCSFEKVTDEEIIKEKNYVPVPVLEMEGVPMSYTEALKWINSYKETIE